MEIRGEVNAAATLAVIGDQAFDRQIELADEQPVRVAIDEAAHQGQHLQRFRAVGGVHGQERVIGTLARVMVGVRRVVAAVVVLDELAKRVDAKAIYAALEP